ncbi:hypothetical protein MUB24_04705 [Lederbergia sp. NSJ-179]|uniref:TcaA 3rd/4th domain-containing protein n=1 Tax=Lederbergia sp. NSJ-179 TaxID=2931402 RepID=UPI001FD42D91|nr:hypothetical protein [Lederbergia sp. NSJ-179]MCJ7840223.1 hypothetical protein [Lederbergia sp. NSJ-179]
MKCKKCGTEGNSEFCPKCGADLKGKAKSPQMKKWIGFGSLFILLLLIGLIGYPSLKDLTSPHQAVAALKEAVQKKDADRIHSLIQSNKEGWTFEKKDADLLLHYLNEHPEDADTLFNHLTTWAKILEGQTKPDPHLEETYASISMKESGRKWLLFKNYSFFLTPVYIDISVNRDHVKLYINDELVDENPPKNDVNSYGPYSIGTYELKAVATGSHFDATESRIVEAFEIDTPPISEKLTINAGEVNLATAYDHTSVLLNGEKTDIEIGRQFEKFGLLPMDGSATITLEKEFPWGTMRSEEYVIDDQRMDLSKVSALSETDRNKIMEMLNENWKLHTEALVSGDASKMDVPEEYKKAVEKQASQLQGKRKKYVATFIQSRYDVESLKRPVYNEEKDRYELQVEAEYTLNEPELHGYSLLREGDNATVTYYMTVFFDEESKEWKIDHYKTGSFFLTSTNEIKTFDIK